MIKGIFFILLFYFIGECISYLINNFIPGSIIGMVLFFLALNLKIVKSDDVKDVAGAFTRNMAIFFIPASAGLLSSLGIISKFWLSIIVVCSVSTILVIAVVGIIQQKMEKKK
ncbi:MAG: CidA/LrgA family protein [Dysgonomonas sp.]